MRRNPLSLPMNYIAAVALQALTVKSVGMPKFFFHVDDGHLQPRRRGSGVAIDQGGADRSVTPRWGHAER